MAFRLISASLLLLSAAPAFAAGTEQVPEAPTTMLFALGVLGVVIGRRASMKRKDGDRDGREN